MIQRTSSYQQHLPAIVQSDPFIGRFLLAFERVLSGLPPDPDKDPIASQLGLEEFIDRSHTYFDPDQAPEAFLPWLANWVALTLREDWKEEVKRSFIRQIVPLYRQRGTKAGLEKLLRIYTGEGIAIEEFEQIAHYFQVKITLSTNDSGKLRRTQKIARSIIDQEKPAHTSYALQIVFPTMQIRNDPNDPNRLIVGHNTILGTSQSKQLL